MEILLDYDPLIISALEKLEWFERCNLCSLGRSLIKDKTIIQ